MNFQFLSCKSNILLNESSKKNRESLFLEIDRIKSLDLSAYCDSESFMHLPFDSDYQNRILKCVNEKQQLKPRALFVIGIGGSNLGTIAVHEALHGSMYNDMDSPLLFYCADTLDPDKNHYLLDKMKSLLKNGYEVLLTIITKSGTTTETTVNGSLFIDCLQHFRPDTYQKYLVIITDKGSVLEDYADKVGASVLFIPQKVGGRYSVFTAVGLFPLAFLGIDIQELCRGAADMKESCLVLDDENYALQSALWLFDKYERGVRVHDTFIFDAAYESMGKWYRQLMAESLGKKENDTGDFVEAGILPTVSMGTVDLHSMAQLYLGGPRMSCTTFLAVKSRFDQKVPSGFITSAGGSSTRDLQSYILQGVQAAYAHENRPFVSLEIEKTAYDCGQFLQFKMMEIMYLASLIQVNAFDQPQVELYKKEVRKLF